MQTQPYPVLVDLIGTVVERVRIATKFKDLNYEPGRSSQIMASLILTDRAGESFKNKKYPLVSLLMPVDIIWGDYYGVAKIQRIVIATLTDSTDGVKKRYEEGGTFKSILYPLYMSFLRCLAPLTLNNDWETLKHTQRDNPGVQPLGQGSNDFIDSIEILNLEFKLQKQLKTC